MTFWSVYDITQEVLWELLHLPRPAALQDGLVGNGGGGAEGLH